MSAYGIHTHDTLKLGLHRPSGRVALQLDRYFTRRIPDVPTTADHFGQVEFALDGNDRFGTCGPTGVDNLIRLISTGLTGKTVQSSLADVFDLYRRSGNPTFDPKTGAGDNGVELQVMLEALLAGGLGPVKPVCFGRVSHTSQRAIDAAVAIFGGVLWGVTLQKSQQSQTGAWDFHAPHTLWGGHCVMNGRYASQDDGVISWAEPFDTSLAFRRHQLDEVWVVVFPWHLQHPAFLAGVDVEALRRDYRLLTRHDLPSGSVPAAKAKPRRRAAKKGDVRSSAVSGGPDEHA